MKLTTTLIIFSILQVSASTYGQRITIKQKSISLEKVFREIRKQSGYDFMISDQALDADKKMDVNFINLPLTEVISRLSNSEIQISIEDNLIVVNRKQSSIIEKINKYFSSINVRGKVVDEKGAGIAGVAIRVKNGKSVVVSEADGHFILTGVNEDATLTFTYIGYNIREVKAEKDLGLVVLQLADNKLDEVQVMAYGETSRRFSTGNISTITSKQIENKPVQNVLLALQGEVPGIVVRQATGWANSGINIQLQGMNSMNRSNDPLFVVDGVVYGAQLPSQINTVGRTSGSGLGTTGEIRPGNPLNFINPQDIATVSILKGADATSIYGSRGANGVILITTKRGNAGEGRIELTSQEGFSEYPSFAKLMSREEYLNMRRYAYFTTDGLTDKSPEFVNQYDLNGIWDNTRFTDWQQKLIGGTARYSDYSGALSGGNAFDQYRISTSYSRQTTLLRRDDLNDQKVSLSSSLNHSSTNGKFKANLTLLYQFDYNKMPAGDLTASAVSLSPVAPELYKSDGTLNWQIDSNGNPTFLNPLAILERKAYTKTNNFLGNLNLSYTILKGLSLNSSFNYNNLQIKENQSFPNASFSPSEIANGSKPYSQFNRATNDVWNIEPQIHYFASLGRGKLDFLLGSTFQSKRSDQLSTAGLNYSSDLQLEDLGAAGNLFVTGRSISDYRYTAFFSRVNYNLGDKYLINIGFRRDGSSRFGSNNVFHNFYSFGGGWIFSEEKMIKENFRWLSFGKFKASYGTTGNDGIGDYAFLNLYNTSTYPSNYQQSQILVANGIPNANLQWEEVSKQDYGIDLGFFKDKILLSAYYYKNVCSNQLLFYALPSFTGANSYTKNFPAKFQNNGFEFNLSITNFKTKDFYWKTSLNASTVNNKLLEFPDLSTSSYVNSYSIGKSVGAVKKYDYVGVDPITGLYQFRKSDGTITSKASELNLARDGVSVDRLVRLSGGISNTFSYNNLEVGFLFDFVIRNAESPLSGYTPGQFLPTESVGNQPTYLLDYWQAAGQMTTYQKPTSINGDVANLSYLYFANSTFSYGNASYLKLRNVSLSYRFSEKILQKLKFKSASVFVNAQNLFSIDGYRGLDAESSSGSFKTLPPLRTITLGFKLSL